jgi:hypothetical protein
MSRTTRLLLLVVLPLAGLRIVVPLASSPEAQLPAPAPPAPVYATLVAPRRDPFRFVDAAPPALRNTFRDDAERFAPPEPIRPSVNWPILVAILTSGDNDAPVRRAVFEDAAGIVHVRSAGESLDGFRVEAVDSDAVTVVHEVTGLTTGLSIR